MSKRSRGNDYAPSTFPFLAVLLCVIGALILLLVINVTNSRASAKKQVQNELSEAIEQAKEQSDYLVSISEELSARREQVKKRIELRRSELTRTEDHIKRLEDELQDAVARLQALENESPRQANAAENEARIELLKAQIDEERKKLAQKIEQSKDKSPAFSIIPYEGANRTTRRPVYLECIQEGVVIQPEGILISVEDLGPPHGPGNPLDAALRVLRTAYQSRDAVYGITIPPYPLLIVRPDGIHSYALARSAMSGWDDQFGYELIDAQMQLAYPEGVPELGNQLTQALAVAKDRQRSLIAALPARFSRNPFATKPEDSWDSIDANGSGSAGNSGSSGQTGKSAASANATDPTMDGRRWQMVQELPSGVVPPGVGSPALGSPALGPPGGLANGGLVKGGLAKGDGQTGFESTGGPLSGDTLAVNDSPQSELDLSAGGTGNSAMNRQGLNGSSGSAGAEGNGTQKEGSLMASGTGSGSAANRFSNATSGSSGGSTSLAQTADDAQMELAIKEQAMKEQAVAAQAKESQANKQKSVQRSATNKASGSDSELKPISLTAGKDWATTRMDNKSTPVSRPIRIIVLQDRWLMCQEGQDWKYDAQIPLEQGPQGASEQLQIAIRDRVDSWGLSLPGGYWVPSLTVQAAADADQSVQRLQKLLEGSGVVIRVQPLVNSSVGK